MEAGAVARPGSVYPAAGLGLPPRAGVPGDDLRVEVPLEQIGFRQVATPAQLRQVAHLRENIVLPAELRESPAFARLEKKETSWAWSAPSSAWEP
ncbi:MAG TPA: hypothetical protein VFE82_08580 [Ramlibacter sp.]|jgi:hypothetical protein|uniref:hypothetical protein n=1 Tax=Ramlibacter sp. TaxID=1917967 RepID=UPI002D703959|nr:hypothetical protein [Ramlibacter sp.]HZY18524.1 hypothetical protein [Ramlibacter sp.]